MISQRDELRNEGEHIQQQQNRIDGEPTIILQEKGSQPNANSNDNNRGQRMKWTKQLNIDIIRCYFNTILQIPNQPYRTDFHTWWTTLHPENLRNRTKNLWSTEGDNEKRKHSRKHQKCMDHVIWNTSTEKCCIKGNWKWKESTTKWAQQCRCSDWRWTYWPTSQYHTTRRKRYQTAKWHQWEWTFKNKKDNCQCLCRKHRYSFR